MEQFRQLYETNFKKVNYYLRTLCNSEKLAEDLTQDTFYRALVFMMDRNNYSTSVQWLVKIAHNVFVDYVRKNRIPLEDLEDIHSEFPGEHPDHSKRLDLVQILNQLPLRYKSFILLCDHYGFSYREIAEIMNCTESTVKVTLSRARNRFKEVYAEYERGTR
mgnify:CR=1 FL=1